QNVPDEVLEAAEIDGATGWKKTWTVTIPMIWDAIVLSVILCISGSLRTFDLIYVMTNGGPAHATEVMAIYMFEQTFSSMRYGYGSAVSLLIFVFSFSIILIVSGLLMIRDWRGGHWTGLVTLEKGEASRARQENVERSRCIVDNAIIDFGQCLPDRMDAHQFFETGKRARPASVFRPARLRLAQLRGGMGNGPAGHVFL